MRGARVLYVDDDPRARSALAKSLSELGYVVRTAHDGPSGIDAFRQEPADVVLLDLRLHGMEAVAVCRTLKELAGEAFLPVIFVTADSDVTEKVRALERGGDDFCVEPMRMDELDARIRVLLRLRDRECRLRSESSRFRVIAYVDALTELANRRALEKELGHAWARAMRSGRPVALLIADIDRFKSFNDRFGHGTGDEVLRAVSRSMLGSVRDGDQVFRMGGEEFVVLAPDCDRAGAIVIAERVRRAVAATKVEPPPDASSRGAHSVTVSIGFAIAPGVGISSPTALLELADRALYDAKAAGRDRVVASAGASLRSVGSVERK